MNGVRDGSLDRAAALDAARRALPATEADTRAAAATVLCLCDAFDEADRALGHRQQTEPAAVLAARGRLSLGRGRPIEARELLRRSLDVEPTADTAADLRECARLLGDAADDHSTELADALQDGAVARAAGIINPAVARWRGRAAEAALRLGERDRALELGRTELVLARAFGAPRPVGAALRVLGTVEDAERLLLESVAALDGTGAELELARARIALGAKLRRAGRRVDARELLRSGLDAAERLGAAPIAGLAREELKATGAKPRRDVLIGAESLTPSERRVAELAATGLTNRQIAQELFVTMRTVTTHLTHIFQKLEIEGRDGIAAVLAADTGPARPAVRADETSASVAVVAGRPIDSAEPPALPADLSPAARELAAAAALMLAVAPSDPVHLGLAGAVAELEHGRAEAAHAELIDAAVIEPGLAVRISQPGLAESIYAAISPALKARRHREAAGRLGAQPDGARAAAWHLARTAPAGDPGTVELLRTAARSELAAGEPERAVSHLRRALIEPPPREGVAALTAELGEVEAIVRDPAADGRLAAGDLDTARLRLAEVRTLGGRPAAAHEVLVAATRALGDEVEPARLAPLESLRGCLALSDRRFATDLDGRLGLARALSVAAGDSGRSLAAIEAFWEWQTMRSGASRAALLDRSLAPGSSAAVDREAVAGLMLAQLVGDDDTRRAERALDALFDESRRRGAVAGVVLALGWSAQLSLRSGELTAAVAQAHDALRLTEGRDLGAVRPLVAAFLAEARLARGAVEEAAAALDGIELAGQEGSALDAFVSYARGLVHVAAGRREEAIDQLERCRSASAGLFVDNPNVIPSRSALAALIAPEDAQRAQALVDEELSLARRLRRPRAIGVALHARARIVGSIEALREAVDMLARAPAPVAHAHALADLGDALAAAGDPGTGEVFAGALAAALRCGATALAEDLAARL